MLNLKQIEYCLSLNHLMNRKMCILGRAEIFSVKFIRYHYLIYIRICPQVNIVYCHLFELLDRSQIRLGRPGRRAMNVTSHNPKGEMIDNDSGWEQ